MRTIVYAAGAGVCTVLAMDLTLWLLLPAVLFAAASLQQMIGHAVIELADLLDTPNRSLERDLRAWIAGDEEPSRRG